MPEVARNSQALGATVGLDGPQTLIVTIESLQEKCGFGTIGVLPGPVTVCDLIPGSIVALAGVQNGMRILSVNDVPTVDLDEQSMARLLRQRPCTISFRKDGAARSKIGQIMSQSSAGKAQASPTAAPEAPMRGIVSSTRKLSDGASVVESTMLGQDKNSAGNNLILTVTQRSTRIGVGKYGHLPGQIFVQRVAPVSAAVEANILPGYEIVSVNDVAVAQLSEQQYIFALKNRPVTIHFVIRDKDTLPMTKTSKSETDKLFAKASKSAKSKLDEDAIALLPKFESCFLKTRRDAQPADGGKELTALGFDINGLEVTRVLPNSQAAQSGLQTGMAVASMNSTLCSEIREAAFRSHIKEVGGPLIFNFGNNSGANFTTTTSSELQVQADLEKNLKILDPKRTEETPKPPERKQIVTNQPRTKRDQVFWTHGVLAALPASDTDVDDTIKLELFSACRDKEYLRRFPHSRGHVTLNSLTGGGYRLFKFLGADTEGVDETRIMEIVKAAMRYAVTSHRVVTAKVVLEDHRPCLNLREFHGFLHFLVDYCHLYQLLLANQALKISLTPDAISLDVFDEISPILAAWGVDVLLAHSPDAVWRSVPKAPGENLTTFDIFAEWVICNTRKNVVFNLAYAKPSLQRRPRTADTRALSRRISLRLSPWRQITAQIPAAKSERDVARLRRVFVFLDRLCGSRGYLTIDANFLTMLYRQFAIEVVPLTLQEFRHSAKLTLQLAIVDDQLPGEAPSTISTLKDARAYLDSSTSRAWDRELSREKIDFARFQGLTRYLHAVNRFHALVLANARIAPGHGQGGDRADLVKIRSESFWSFIPVLRRFGVTDLDDPSAQEVFLKTDKNRKGYVLFEEVFDWAYRRMLSIGSGMAPKVMSSPTKGSDMEIPIAGPPWAERHWLDKPNPWAGLGQTLSRSGEPSTITKWDELFVTLTKTAGDKNFLVLGDDIPGLFYNACSLNLAGITIEDFRIMSTLVFQLAIEESVENYRAQETLLSALRKRRAYLEAGSLANAWIVELAKVRINREIFEGILLYLNDFRQLYSLLCAVGIALDSQGEPFKLRTVDRITFELFAQCVPILETWGCGKMESDAKVRSSFRMIDSDSRGFVIIEELCDWAIRHAHENEELQEYLGGASLIVLAFYYCFFL